MKRRTFVAHGFVNIGRALAEIVDAAMNVGIVVFHKARHRFDNHTRFLRAGPRIQIGEGVIVNLLRQERENLCGIVRPQNFAARRRRRVRRQGRRMNRFS